jgi:hypothetical protein
MGKGKKTNWMKFLAEFREKSGNKYEHKPTEVMKDAAVEWKKKTEAQKDAYSSKD